MSRAPIDVEKLVAGLGLSGVGVVWLLDNLGRVDGLETLHRWWALLLVVWGGLELTVALARRAGSRRTR
jgi:hypothetical protein